jgi:hypothetical protein
MATHNTIRLMDYSNKFKEFELSGAAYPGMLMERDTGNDGKVKPHSSTDGTDPQRMFLFERELLGEEMNTEVASGEKAQVWYPSPGDVVYAILADGENVSNVGDPLTSNGDGKLKQNNTTGAVVAYALETLDLSASSGAESTGPLGYDKRIKVEVV